MGTPFNKLHQISLTLFFIFFINQVTKINVTNARSLTDAPNYQGDKKDLVSFACKHTLYQDICITSLSSDPHTKSCSDLKDLAKIALTQSFTQAKQTQCYIKELIKSRNSKNDTHGNLGDCKEEYGEAVVDLKEAVEALSKGDYGSVNELVSGAMTDCQTCLDGSQESNSEFSGNKDEMMGSFVDKNQYFYKLCSNTLAIVKLLG